MRFQEPASCQRTVPPQTKRCIVQSLALLLVLLCGCSNEPERSEQSVLPAVSAAPPWLDAYAGRRPNIVLIVADDLGYGSLGSYGQERILTPHLDAMATQGMRFTSFYAGAPSCSPARDSMMTGRHSGHTFIRSNLQVEGGGQLPLPADSTTIAKLLKRSGYATAAIGKWGLGDVGSEGVPSNHGFDHFFGYLNQVLAHNSFPEFLWRNDEKVYLTNEVVYVDSSHWTSGLGSYSSKKVDYAPDFLTREAEGFIERNADRPFFLYLPYTAPHINGEAPVGYEAEVPSLGVYADKDWPDRYKAHAAMLTRFDSDVGRILRKLSQEGLELNTLVIFTSDNGAGECPVDAFFDSNGSLRGGKFGLYEGGIRVPMIARWPGRIAAGSESSLLSAHWDLLATSAEVAGIANPPPTDGISLLPTLLGHPQRATHDLLYWEFPSRGGTQAVRSNAWKAILFADPNRMEIYDVEEDPGELRNLAAEYPLLAYELAQAMQTAHSASQLFPLLPDERSYRSQLRRFVKLAARGTPTLRVGPERPNVSVVASNAPRRASP